MAYHLVLNHNPFTKSWKRWIFLVGMLVLLSTSVTLPVAAQSSSGGLGVGQGDGQEVGIKLSTLNQIKTEIATGAYDRPCSAAEHDPTKWHTLVNVQAKCHYDHTHGDDPTYVNDIFGEPGEWFGASGQSISYPWQTFKAQTDFEENDAYIAAKQMENDLKHEGYIWVVRRNQPCPNGNCLTDFRLQAHAIFGAHDMPVRYHSFSFEGRMCAQANNPSSCGIVRWGGWADFGRLFTTAPNEIRCDHGVNEIFIPLPADTQFFPIDRPADRDEIRCHPNITSLPAYPSPRPLAEWWAKTGAGVRFQLRVFDPIGNVDQADPSRWQFFCAQTDLNCRYDSSIISVFVGYVVQIREFYGGERVDANRDGRTDYSGYMSRWGEPEEDCTEIGLDCIPNIISNVRLNTFNNKEAQYVHTVCENCQRVDMDISRSGQKWITWFYRYASPAHNTTPTATVVAPTATVITPTATPITPTPTAIPTTPVATTPPTDPTTPTVRVDLSTTSANAGERVEATLKLFNVSNLYGLQAQCTTDPSVLVGADAAAGDAFPANSSFFVNNQFKTDTGAWTVGASLLQPAAPIAGNMTAFKLGYTVHNGGGSAVNCSVLGVDANGQEIPLQVINGMYVGNGTAPTMTVPGVTNTPTVVAPTATTPAPTMTTPPTEPTATVETPMETPPPTALSTIAGTAKYQNRPDQAGISVQLLNGTTPLVSLMTNANGTFSFTDVPAGNYILEASASGHLKFSAPVAVQADGQTVDVGTITLLAGDTDNNGTVNLADASMIGANFGFSAPPAPTEADLNVDAVVNVRDLVLVGGNFGKTGTVVTP
jgi:hypothetical protein